MKLTTEKHQKVLDIIHEHRLTKDRIKALKRFGFKVVEYPLKWGSRACIGITHYYARSARIQVGCPKGYMKYAWMVIFDPADFEYVHDLNRKTFGRTL